MLLVAVADCLALAINCDGKNLINCDLIAKNTFSRGEQLGGSTLQPWLHWSHAIAAAATFTALRVTTLRVQ